MRGVTLRVEFDRWTGTPSPGALRAPTSPRRRGEVKTAPLFLHLSPRAGRGRIALAIRVRGALGKRGGYRFENASHVAQNIVVPESQNAVPVIDKPFVANRVARVVRVLASIDFNDESAFAADQIDGVRTDRLLPDEFVTFEATRSELISQSRFRFGRNSTKAPRASGLDFIGSAHAAPPPHPDCFGRCFRIAEAIRPLPARGERLAPRAAK